MRLGSVLWRATRGWRVTMVIVMAVASVAGRRVVDAERRADALRAEVGWLRTRLADKRELIARQRQEMAEVASAVDRVAHATTALRERASLARHLAHVEETREAPPRITPVAATLDGSSAIVSEDAARALEELAWLDGQAASATDSFALLSVMLREHPNDAIRGVPTVWPVRGLVTSPFGARMSPYGEGAEMHPGIDIAARWGQPVTAAGNGQVIFAGRDGGYGSLVIVDHGGHLDSLYGHLSALYVREGQPVRRGQAIGAVGATGRATGAHLHYEVRVHGSPVDPRRYLVN
jgi:murein DD-endopeptidase MepM/ murein hydrolase activator NlpD